MRKLTGLLVVLIGILVGCCEVWGEAQWWISESSTAPATVATAVATPTLAPTPKVPSSRIEVPSGTEVEIFYQGSSLGIFVLNMEVSPPGLYSRQISDKAPEWFHGMQTFACASTGTLHWGALGAIDSACGGYGTIQENPEGWVILSTNPEITVKVK